MSSLWIYEYSGGKCGYLCLEPRAKEASEEDICISIAALQIGSSVPSF